MNFCEILGFGVVVVGLDEVLKVKLNFEGELLCVVGLVGGGWFGGVMDLLLLEDGSGFGVVLF